jgi:hypothetical protein
MGVSPEPVSIRSGLSNTGIVFPNLYPAIVLSKYFADVPNLPPCFTNPVRRFPNRPEAPDENDTPPAYGGGELSCAIDFHEIERIHSISVKPKRALRVDGKPKSATSSLIDQGSSVHPVPHAMEFLDSPKEKSKYLTHCARS